MATGEEIEPPVKQEESRLMLDSPSLDNFNPPTQPKRKIFGGGPNKFEDAVQGGKVSTKLGGKTVENAKADLTIDRQLRTDVDFVPE